MLFLNSKQNLFYRRANQGVLVIIMIQEPVSLVRVQVLQLQLASYNTGTNYHFQNDKGKKIYRYRAENHSALCREVNKLGVGQVVRYELQVQNIVHLVITSLYRHSLQNLKLLSLRKLRLSIRGGGVSCFVIHKRVLPCLGRL